MNKRFLKMFCITIIAYMTLTGSDCDPDDTMPPAERNTEEVTAKLVILSGSYNGCSLDPNDIEYMLVNVVSTDGLVKIPAQQKSSADVVDPTGGRYFNIKVPKVGNFTIDVMVMGNCDLCCQSNFRSSTDIPGCSPYPKQGKPFYKSYTTYGTYVNQVYNITPTLNGCLCTCP